jgi:uncharacterized protein YaaR (DUF327 family)
LKINSGWNPIGKNVKINDNAPLVQNNSKNFGDMLQQHDQNVSHEQLKDLLNQIGNQADRLSKSMTVRELRQYKLLVKKFLEETARQGVAIKDTRGWDRRGRGKRYKLLEEVDHELLEMAENLLESEQGRIDLLQKVGEIRGLLVNFLF